MLPDLPIKQHEVSEPFRNFAPSAFGSYSVCKPPEALMKQSQLKVSLGSKPVDNRIDMGTLSNSDTLWDVKLTPVKVSQKPVQRYDILTASTKEQQRGDFIHDLGTAASPFRQAYGTKLNSDGFGRDIGMCAHVLHNKSSLQQHLRSKSPSIEKSPERTSSCERSFRGSTLALGSRSNLSHHSSIHRQIVSKTNLTTKRRIHAASPKMIESTASF